MAQSQDQRHSVEAGERLNTANLLVSRARICCMGNNCKLIMPRRAISFFCSQNSRAKVKLGPFQVKDNRERFQFQVEGELAKY